LEGATLANVSSVPSCFARCYYSARSK